MKSKSLLFVTLFVASTTLAGPVMGGGGVVSFPVLKCNGTTLDKEVEINLVVYNFDPINQTKPGSMAIGDTDINLSCKRSVKDSNQWTCHGDDNIVVQTFTANGKRYGNVLQGSNEIAQLKCSK